jgi:hypothetical protein
VSDAILWTETRFVTKVREVTKHGIENTVSVWLAMISHSEYASWLLNLRQLHLVTVDTVGTARRVR